MFHAAHPLVVLKCYNITILMNRLLWTVNEQLSCDLVNAFHVSFKKGGQRYSDIVGYKRSMDVFLKRTTKQFDNLGGFNSNYLFNVGDEGSLVTSLNKGKC
uniref:Uncharacterized protein n=1 Tax=Hyaloperonospora arabidopsidis (strain Emoy2) TaxID=559515 RepID=M4B3A2_HYAAE